MRARSRWIRQGLALTGALVLPPLGAFAGGLLQVTRCVDVPDGMVQLGIRLALLRPAAHCPTTGLALGGEREQLLGIALMLTLPMALLHLLAVGGGWGAWRALRRSRDRLARLVPWRLLPRDVTAPVARRQPLARRAVRVLRDGDHLRVPLLRGPPVPQPA